MWMAESDDQTSRARARGAVETHNARYGLWLFGVYVALYGGFMGLNAFAPEVMSKSPFGGVNLAIIYGLGLIVAAFVLALVYTLLCRRESDGGER
jgi:uncharacterized membrane protein (DUF485 family)